MSELEAKRGILRYLLSKGKGHCSCGDKLVKALPPQFRQGGNRILKEMVDEGLLRNTKDGKYCVDMMLVLRVLYFQYPLSESSDISNLIYRVCRYEKQIYSIDILQGYVYCWQKITYS